MNKTRVAVIGAGRMGKIRLENLSRMPDVEVVALASNNVDEIRTWAESLGVQQIYEDSRPIFADESIDAVVICSTTDSHPELIKAAAARKMHIFCEKPIANDLASTKEVLQEVDRSGIVFQLGFNRRHDPNFVKIKGLIADDTLGEVQIVNIHSRDPERPHPGFVERSGGMYVDMMIHDFDMIRYLTGSDIEEVYATGACLIDPAIGEAGDVDTACVIVRLKNGSLATIDNSRETHYGYDQRVEVFGSKGNAYAHHKREHQVEVSDANSVTKAKPLYYLTERYMDSFALEIREFILTIKNNSAPLVGGDDGLKAFIASEAARKSYLENRPVKISEII